MVVKTLTITEEAYRRLKALKNNNSQSFSQVIIEITNKSHTNVLDQFFGILKNKGESAEILQKKLKKYRKDFDKGSRDKKLKRQLYDNS